MVNIASVAEIDVVVYATLAISRETSPVLPVKSVPSTFTIQERDELSNELEILVT